MNLNFVEFLRCLILKIDWLIVLELVNLFSFVDLVVYVLFFSIIYYKKV